MILYVCMYACIHICMQASPTVFVKCAASFVDAHMFSLVRITLLRKAFKWGTVIAGISAIVCPSL